METLNESDLPTLKGPLTEFSRAETATIEKFIAQFNYRISAKNQARYHRRWKRLHEIHKAGVKKLLYYRNTSLDYLYNS